MKNYSPQSGRTIDISPTGTSVIVSEHMPSGASAVVASDASINGRLFEIDATARFAYSICMGTTGFRTGLQFIETDEATSRTIRELAR